MKKELQITQLSKKLEDYKVLQQSTRPINGWIKAIRTTLGMSLEQLANRLQVSKQNIQSMEKREQEMAITLKSLQEVAQAMDMQLVYALVPKDDSLTALIERKAYELALNIVERTSQNMALENQQVNEAQAIYAVKKRKQAIIQEMPKALWD
ncbi:mobile mystery protein A [Pedobacter sp. SL55]|uniref:mobile mystery protein A n=1 Tax=Pedobacter sp. SL55 TaxID=2995161 RepID=UPI00226FC09C|nr:mobile mystery protein A [Pedobacter sp. SL55]WAC41158.1 mobile mystery protein A [Pedobacter sp. SL55]